MGIFIDLLIVSSISAIHVSWNTHVLYYIISPENMYCPSSSHTLAKNKTSLLYGQSGTC